MKERWTRLKEYVFRLFHAHILFFKKVWPGVIPFLFFMVGAKFINLFNSIIGYATIALALGLASDELFKAKLVALHVPVGVSGHVLWLMIAALVGLSALNLVFDKLALSQAGKILSKNGVAFHPNEKPRIIVEQMEKSIAPMMGFIDFLSELVFLISISLIVLVFSPLFFLALLLITLSIAGMQKMIASKKDDPNSIYHQQRLGVLYQEPDAEIKKANQTVEAEKVSRFIQSRVNVAMSSRYQATNRTVISSLIFIFLVVVILNIDINLKSLSLALIFLIMVRQAGTSITNMLNHNRNFLQSI